MQKGSASPKGAKVYMFTCSIQTYSYTAADDGESTYVICRIAWNRGLRKHTTLDCATPHRAGNGSAYLAIGCSRDVAVAGWFMFSWTSLNARTLEKEACQMGPQSQKDNLEQVELPSDEYRDSVASQRILPRS